MTKKYEPLVNRICAALDGPAKAAKKLKITVQAIHKWKEFGVPAERVLQIERATDGSVTRHQIRPDLYPNDEASA